MVSETYILNSVTLHDIDDFIKNAVDLNNVGYIDSKSVSQLYLEFSSLNIEKGSIILICLPNGIPLIKYFFATLLSGLVPLLISPSTSFSRLNEIAINMGAAVLITNKSDINVKSYSYVHQFSDNMNISFYNHSTLKYSKGDVIILTSGTSGVLSGCLHSFDSLVKNACRHIKATEQKSNDIILINLPMYYSYALVAQVLASLLNKNKIIISGPPFTVENYWKTIIENNVTFSSITPYLIKILFDRGAKLPECLRTLTVGGDYIAPVYIEHILKSNPNKELYVTYGLTEAGPRVATLAAHMEQASKFSSVGKPLDGVTVSLNKEFQEHDTGELIVQTDTICKRKVGIIDDSTKIFSNNCLTTGDIFKIDDHGYLFFSGRKSDFIIMKGEKVSLSSIKKIVCTIPNVVKVTTHVITNKNDIEYNLDIYVKESVANQSSIRANINKLLLRTERPSNINIVTAPDSFFSK